MPVTCWSTASATPSKQHPPHPRLPKLGEPAAFGGDRLVDGAELHLGELLPIDAGQNGQRLAAALVLDEPAGALGHQPAGARKTPPRRRPRKRTSNASPTARSNLRRIFDGQIGPRSAVADAGLAEEVGHLLAFERQVLAGDELVDLAAVRLGQPLSSGCLARAPAPAAGRRRQSSFGSTSAALLRRETGHRPAIEHRPGLDEELLDLPVRPSPSDLLLPDRVAVEASSRPVAVLRDVDRPPLSTASPWLTMK